MSGTLEIDHKKMHDIKSAAAAAGYTRDHITALARAGKIVAAQIERQWYVDLDSLMQYVKVTTLEQEVKQKHLSEERRTAHDHATLRTTRKRHRTAATAAYKKQLHASVAAFAALLIGTAGVLSQVAPSLLAPSSVQLASTKVPVGVLDLLETSGPVVTAETASVTFSDDAVEVRQLATADEAIVILPVGVSEPLAAFSDAVVIEELNGTTTIRLVADDRVVPVGVVTVPVVEKPNL